MKFKAGQIVKWDRSSEYTTQEVFIVDRYDKPPGLMLNTTLEQIAVVLQVDNTKTLPLVRDRNYFYVREEELTLYTVKIEEYEIVDKNPVGKKDDGGKPDMTDVPKEAMWAMGEAFLYGQKKYGKNNYRNGMMISRQLAAAIRHIYQHLDGETVDSESGALHLGHALASISMACYNLENNPEMDDRFQKDKDKWTNVKK